MNTEKNTYTVILNKNENKHLEDYKEHFDHKAGSKAFKSAIFAGIENDKKIKKLEDDYEELKVIHLSLLNALSQSSDGLALILELVGQKDLFTA